MRANGILEKKPLLFCFINRKIVGQRIKYTNYKIFRMFEGNHQHAQGAFGIEGWADHWMTQRRQGLARLHNRPRERQQYDEALDRLFLQCEEVIYKDISEK